MSEDTEQPGPEPAAGTPEDRPHRRSRPSGCRRQPASGGSRCAGAPALRGERQTRAERAVGDDAADPTGLPPPARRSSYPPPPPGTWAPPPAAATPARPRRSRRRPSRSPTRRRATRLPDRHPSGIGPRQPRQVRTWLPVVLVAALIGGGIGAGVTALAEQQQRQQRISVTIHESSAAPGAAVLSGNVTIPELVNKVIHAVVSIDVKATGTRTRAPA